MFFLDATATPAETPSRPPTTSEIIIGTIFLILIIIGVIIGAIITKKKEEKWIQEHSRPLNQEELQLLHDINVKNYIEKTYNFLKSGFGASDWYRSSLDASGRLDNLDIPIEKIPLFLTDLLKYKRHEWIAFVFCDEKDGKYIWLNKGPDNQKVWSFVSEKNLLEFAKKHNCNTIIEFHNHPHTVGDGNLLGASKQDLHSTEIFEKYFNDNGVSFISGLCSQGCFLIYGYAFHENSCPIEIRMNSLIKYNMNATVEQQIEMHRKIRRVYSKVKPIKLKVIHNADKK